MPNLRTTDWGSEMREAENRSAETGANQSELIMDATATSPANILSDASGSLSWVSPPVQYRQQSMARVQITMDKDSASSTLVGIGQRRITSRIAKFSFGATVILLVLTLAGILLDQFWLAALAAPTMIGGIGLLYTAGMDLNDIDRKLMIIYSE